MGFLFNRSGQNNVKSFGLILFCTDPTVVPIAVNAGIEAIVVDWENADKTTRQFARDTEINYDTIDDLRNIRAATQARVLCRINPFSAATPGEVDNAISAGADEILLPMVRQRSEIEATLKHVDKRCGLGILLETNEAVRYGHEWTDLPLSRVYVGLNDLAIERHHRSIFTSLIDGTVETLRNLFDVPFGFGGLTLPDRGSPVPCRLMIAEMIRLNCHFSFLRRSFKRDIRGHNWPREIERILKALENAYTRTTDEIESDRSELTEIVKALASSSIEHV